MRTLLLIALYVALIAIAFIIDLIFSTIPQIPVNNITRGSIIIAFSIFVMIPLSGFIWRVPIGTNKNTTSYTEMLFCFIVFTLIVCTGLLGIGISRITTPEPTKAS